MSARKRVRTFLQAPSVHPDGNANELLHRRWETNNKYRDLRVEDVRDLLNRADSEREARKVAERVIHEKLELQRKHTAALQAISRRARESAQQHNETAALRTQVRNLQDLLRGQDQPSGQDEVLLPNTVRFLQNTVRKLREENAQVIRDRDRWEKLARARGRDLDGLRKPGPGLDVEDLRKLAEDLLPRITAFFAGGEK